MYQLETEKLSLLNNFKYLAAILKKVVPFAKTPVKDFWILIFRYSWHIGIQKKRNREWRIFLAISIFDAPWSRQEI